MACILLSSVSFLLMYSGKFQFHSGSSGLLFEDPGRWIRGGPYPRACPIGSPNPSCSKVPAAGGIRFSEVGWPSGGVRVLGFPGLSVYLFCGSIGELRGPCIPVSISSNPL